MIRELEMNFVLVNCFANCKQRAIAIDITNSCLSKHAIVESTQEALRRAFVSADTLVIHIVYF